MFDGNMFLPETGTPMRRIDRRRTRFAVWLPEPLTVATWILKSLTTFCRLPEACCSCTARSLGGMLKSLQRMKIEGKTTNQSYHALVARSLLPRLRATSHIEDRLAHVGGAFHDSHAGGRERRHLLGCGALSAGDDRAGVTHATPRRRGLAGDERDDGLLQVAFDPGRRFFLGAAADLSNHDDGVGVRVFLEQLQRVDVRGADQRVSA